MARNSGQWGGPQHQDYLREQELRKVQEVHPTERHGCGWMALWALAVVVAAGAIGYASARMAGWLL